MKVGPPRAVAEILLRQITNEIQKKTWVTPFRKIGVSFPKAVCRSQIFQSQEGRKQLLSERFGVISSLFHPPSRFSTNGAQRTWAAVTQQWYKFYPKKGVGCCVWLLEASVIFAKMFNDISNSLQAVLKTDTNRLQTTKPFGQGTLESALSRSSGSSSKPNSSISSLRSCEFGTVEKGISDRSFESEGWGVIWKCP